MEKLIKNPTFLMIGAGVLAFAVANMIINRKPKGTEQIVKGKPFVPINAQNEFTNFLGACACANGVSGSCATNCSTCCARSGGVAKKNTASFNFEGEDNSDFCGCGA